MNFKDHFSLQSKQYAKYRPTYPPELFQYLSSIVENHTAAWDSATGNGQAALGLVPYFDKITATDASSEQIKNAVRHPKIKYIVATAENSGLESNSIDIITAATAIHWFDTNTFYNEVHRILKSNGAIAVWAYLDSKITGKIDDVITYYTKNILGKYFLKEANRYKNFDKEIGFPFKELKTPRFKIEHQWSFEDYINYLSTWSHTQNYIKINNSNPIELIYDKFKNAWGNEKRNVSWDLFIKVGRLS